MGVGRGPVGVVVGEEELGGSDDESGLPGLMFAQEEEVGVGVEGSRQLEVAVVAAVVDSR